MEKSFKILQKSRALTLTIINKLSMEQLNKIPPGFNNNIAWNIAHLVVTQQLLCYKLSNQNCQISNTLIEEFQKGTSPKNFVSEASFAKIIEQFIQLPMQLESDYDAGVFTSYHPYTTSVDITLNNIEEAINFNNYHEGIHLGIILQLLKFV